MRTNVYLQDRGFAALRTLGGLFLIFGFASSPAFSACHVVTPTGSGSYTGADWNNALKGTPSSPVRGDIYYFADGTYSYIDFEMTASGTSTVEFRKAQTYDHCTDVGWAASTMGSGQAVFPGSYYGNIVVVNQPYFILNGNGRSTSAGCGGAPGTTVTASPPAPADCGFKLDNSSDSAGTTIWNEVSASAHVTFEYIELSEPGDNAKEQYDVFGPGAGPSTYAHIYGHNAGCVYFQDGGDTRTISSSYFWGTETHGATGGCHGQFSFESGSTSNSSEWNNVYRDITGTAIWTFANTSTTHNNWLFYNNVIYNSFPTASWAPYLSDGTIACINAGTNCTNFQFMQNTVANINVPGINNENTGSYTVEDNLYYEDANPPSFNVGTGGSYIQDHNSCVQSGTCPSGTANVTDTSAPNLFTNWTGGNFTLASENADWNNRLPLSSLFTTDPAGTTRTTDRGAYQYIQLGLNTIATPTALTAIVN